MKVILYRNSSDVNFIDKSISKIYELEGYLRGECSVTDPEFEIELNGSVESFNYFYIPEFGNRYYYLTEMVCVKNGLYRISGHVDVLMTYRDGIRNNYALVARQANTYNLYLDDDKFRVTARRKYSVRTFSGNTPSGAKMVLIAAGGDS